MTPEPRLHFDDRGRVFVENATAEILEALRALGWPADPAGPEPVAVTTRDDAPLEA